MTESRDWLSDALDRHPGEAVPEDFAIRLMSRIRAERRPPVSAAPALRRFALAAGALVVLGLGYWLGMGAPSLHEPVRIGDPGDTAGLEIEEIWRNRDLLESWDLLNDPDLQLGLAATISGAGLFEAESAPAEEPR